MKKIIKYLIFFIVLIGIGYFGYIKFLKEDEKVDYFTVKPSSGDLLNSVAATGEVLARDLVDVGAQVGGQIQKLYVSLGDTVKKGDTIADIDSVKQANEIAKLNAQHRIYMADLNATSVALKIAKTKYDREKKLYRSNATSKESLENAENEIAFNMAKVEQIKAQIDQNMINLDTAKTNLGYTKIVAPLDGTIVSVLVKEGQTVNANQSTPVIVQIADLTKLEINMEIAEGDLPKVQTGMKVRYSILAEPNKKMTGYIDSIDPAMTTLSDGSLSKLSASQSSNSAVYYYGKVLVDNHDNFLKIGMTVENSIIIEESKDTIYIPKNLIFKKDNSSYVKVLKGSKIVEKSVKLGISDGFYQEILEGIDVDDDIISSTKSGKKEFKGQMGPPRRATRM
ncbi:macrolide-specific efflux protein, membrane fusion protein MacA [Campylobacter blaseri]|uniref:Efflux transporter periplasmic adaptor subunit n=1 Tax=Campylobacter blaseri TaxID=2042961 RepID=A0A2P8R2C6_9BACT|nr:efflux RND transporter periplasmic adaptor subunit [Campylobacter blaseri]PSM52650.1 efflux transporter periplasmic adaptor subunit [Campylobacter blaseri]PSM54298.1 efflux transporter periplasmic adaptor subunit [Campylobacter blaseri]QKF85949.1 macrolide-specific efflux protein, membrane fusion protein MacA [Campylobacter blaseri]